LRHGSRSFGNFFGSLDDLQVLEGFLMFLENNKLEGHGDDDDNVNGAEAEVTLLVGLLLNIFTLLRLSQTMSNFVLLDIWIQFRSPLFDEIVSFLHFRGLIFLIGRLLLSLLPVSLVSLDWFSSDVQVVQHLVKILALLSDGSLEGSSSEIYGDILLSGNSGVHFHELFALRRDEEPAEEEEDNAVESPSEGDPGVLVVLAPSGDSSSHDEVAHDKGEEEHASGHHVETVVKLEFVFGGLLRGYKFLGFGVAEWEFASLSDKRSVMSSTKNGLDS
jgi:hypothetical protein